MEKGYEEIKVYDPSDGTTGSVWIRGIYDDPPVVEPHPLEYLLRRTDD